jgi:predicted Zn-ribbon and HTH transcriptional regulator
VGARLALVMAFVLGPAIAALRSAEPPAGPAVPLVKVRCPVCGLEMPYPPIDAAAGVMCPRCARPDVRMTISAAKEAAGGWSLSRFVMPALFLGIPAVLLVLFVILSRRRAAEEREEAQEMLQAVCRACGYEFPYRASLAGSRGKCPSCGEIIIYGPPPQRQAPQSPDDLAAWRKAMKRNRNARRSGGG